jgi:hypothetical protein
MGVSDLWSAIFGFTTEILSTSDTLCSMFLTSGLGKRKFKLHRLRFIFADLMLLHSFFSGLGKCKIRLDLIVFNTLPAFSRNLLS